LTRVTSTEKAMRDVAVEHALGLTEQQIRKDFQLEKDAKFTKTQSFVAVMGLARAKAGQNQALAAIPQITLNSLKIKGFTTERFAKAVYKRYQTCIAAKT
jgi:hypothetical protein